MSNLKIAIIGGTGLENADFFQKEEELDVNTEYGKPSDKISKGKIGNVDVFLLPRHGKKHNITPSNVNYRANITALKQLGITHIVAVTACGSLRENMHPGNFVVIDQFIDKTTKRASTFYDNDNSRIENRSGELSGLKNCKVLDSEQFFNKERVAHIPMHTPFCPQLREKLIQTAKLLKIPVHDKGTMVTIEGPRFSSRAESHFNRLIGGDVINMTTIPECILAREAGICYAAVAMVTDFDCFLEDNVVTLEKVLEQMKNNSTNAQLLLKNVVEKISLWKCACIDDIKSAVM